MLLHQCRKSEAKMGSDVVSTQHYTKLVEIYKSMYIDSIFNHNASNDTIDSQLNSKDNDDNDDDD